MTLTDPNPPPPPGGQINSEQMSAVGEQLIRAVEVFNVMPRGGVRVSAGSVFRRCSLRILMDTDPDAKPDPTRTLGIGVGLVAGVGVGVDDTSLGGVDVTGVVTGVVDF
ncbi:hypothetical protein Droror1_Dr00013390 [Drosera rotundifolia]